MKLGENICIALNKLFPKTKVKGRKSPQSYSEAEYDSAKSVLSLHAPYIDLKAKDILGHVWRRVLKTCSAGCKK